MPTLELVAGAGDDGTIPCYPGVPCKVAIAVKGGSVPLADACIQVPFEDTDVRCVLLDVAMALGGYVLLAGVAGSRVAGCSGIGWALSFAFECLM